jgi:D-methionine transport system ATP-binding protein
METYDGRQIGRMRIELPGRFEDNVVPIGFLREQGLQVDVAAATATTATTDGADGGAPARALPAKTAAVAR